MIYYAAGRLPLRDLYNIEAQRELETRVAGSPLPVKGTVLPFNHTPIFVPLLHLLVNDDYAASYLRWTALLWLAAFVCAFLVFRMTGDVALAFAAGSFYPLFTYIQQAHDTVFLLLGVLLTWVMPCVQAQEAKRHILIADYLRSGFTYTVDGQSPKANEGLLLALSRARSADPSPKPEIVILVDERGKLSDVSNLIGLVIKADYSTYRVFVFDDDTKSMTELKYSAPAPLSRDGSIPNEK